MTTIDSAATSAAVESGSSKEQPQREQSKLGWSFLAKVAPAFSAIGGLCLPLVGGSTHAHYFREWGLDAAMFPIAADMTFVYGYEALVHGFSESLLALVKDYWHVLLGSGLLCVATMLMVVKGAYYRGQLSMLLRGRAKAKGVLRLGVACLVAVALPTMAVPFATISVLLVLVLPLSAAESYAKERVSRQIEEFEVGVRDVIEDPRSEVPRSAEGRAVDWAWVSDRKLRIARRALRPREARGPLVGASRCDDRQWPAADSSSGRKVAVSMNASFGDSSKCCERGSG